MVATHSRAVLGKIAADIHAALAARQKSGAPAGTSGTLLGSGPGWEAADVICTAGPRDHVFEEQHSAVSVAVVVAGSFQYRTARGLHLMTPGSFFLGNPGECFECGHEHAPGDRCVSFRFAPAFIDELAAQLGQRRATFGASRLPPARESSAVVASITTALAGDAAISWEEVAIDVAAAALRAARDSRGSRGSRGSRDDSRSSGMPAPTVVERVTFAIREIEADPSAPRELDGLAATAGLSTFQFLRAFRRLTGATPHQYLLRTRLRESAASLHATRRGVAEIALDCGFNDLSNFNHAFRAEFGVSPRTYRAKSIG